MAKKKAVKRTVVRKTVRTKLVPGKAGKPVVKKRTVVSKKTMLVPAKKTAKKRAKKGGASQSLGRPMLTGDAELDHVFQKDYQAREIFGFLGIKTVKELEGYAPGEIIDRLTSPVVQTVERIRKTLAMANRSLAGDRAFAAEFKSRVRG